VTQGWPHHGSTVVRLLLAPVDLVAGSVAGRARWDTLRLTDGDLEPVRHEGGWAATGRLGLPWTALPVRVELRIVPAAHDRTWAHLVLASRGRFPRRYWSSGHAALAAIDAAAQRISVMSMP
jgi:hypothetical protein